MDINIRINMAARALLLGELAPAGPNQLQRPHPAPEAESGLPQAPTFVLYSGAPPAGPLPVPAPQPPPPPPPIQLPDQFEQPPKTQVIHTPEVRARPAGSDQLVEVAPARPSVWQAPGKSPEAPSEFCPGPGQPEECSTRGVCLTGTCACFPGFSGPSCAIANCPNECSHRGECRLRPDRTFNRLAAGEETPLGQMASQFSSISFASSSSSLQSVSICPQVSDEPASELIRSELNNTWARLRYIPPGSIELYDNRVEWQCVCQAGFAGPDCGQLQELQCDNERDDDADGLVDCEDDDCCSQPVCRDNLMCYKSPDPVQVLANLSGFSSNGGPTPAPAQLPAGRFYNQMRFLIANHSVQSYAREQVFERARAAVVRGRVVKSLGASGSGTAELPVDPAVRQAAERGVVGVRVSVLEDAHIGFTLSRADGHFDMLVNGDQWLTLQFHRNAYVPIKRKLFVRASAINSLDREVEMWLSAAPEALVKDPQQQQQQLQQHAMPNSELRQLDSSFGAQLAGDLFRLASIAAPKRNQALDNERLHNQLFECLLTNLRKPFRLSPQLEPLLVAPDGSEEELLRTFVLAGSPRESFATHLGDSTGSISGRRLQVNYNSAHFPPSASIVKPTVSIQLTPADFRPESQSNRLASIQLWLDVEGQSRRERFVDPTAKLSYHFAWNRRNVYQQKVYGFSELTIRVGYEYEFQLNQSLALLWHECQLGGFEKLATPALLSSSSSSPANREVVWFERKLLLEGHQLNQHSDLGKWTLSSSNRLDLNHETIYFGAGWSLPYKLAYPPVLSKPLSLAQSGKPTPQTSRLNGHSSRLMARGPNSSMFVLTASGRLLQLDATGSRRLLDLPLASLTSRLYLQDAKSKRTMAAGNAGAAGTQQDIQLLYNNQLSTLYLSSRAAGKIVQVGYASLLVLNKTSSAGSSATFALEDEIDIEPLCGFGSHFLQASQPSKAVRLAVASRLQGPHSMTLDEERQVLYFLDGPASIMALDLATSVLSLLPVQQTPANSDAALRNARWNATINSNNNELSCSRSDLRAAFADFRPHKMHALRWSKSDSSLYFLDQNSLLALRQDFSLELIATGSQGRTPPPLLNTFPKANNCFQINNNNLGSIKSLAIDEANDDLLLVHEWTGSPSAANKSAGKLYLATLKLGFRNAGAPPNRPLLDLHSAKSTWDPLVSRLASLERGQESAGRRPTTNLAEFSVNWLELAAVRQPAGKSLPSDPHEPSNQSRERPGGQSSQIIPFIHLIDGFEWLDSLEINLDGSIFVLNSQTDSITILRPYSLANANSEFNLVERHDVNINRLFETSSGGGGGASGPLTNAKDQKPLPFASNFFAPTSAGDDSIRTISNYFQMSQNDEPTGGHDDESRKLKTLIVQNPITAELMEFHSGSGLQLSLTGNNIKSEFYYKLLPITSNKIILDLLDEDDRNDFETQRLISHQNSLHYSNSILRLDKILDSKKNNFEFRRSFSGSRYTLQTVLINYQHYYDLTTDYMGALNTFQQPGKNYWLELVYDSSTYLLRDIVTKEDSSTAQALQSSGFYEKGPNQNNNNLQSTANRNRKKLKRIAHDRVFNHYCDLFIVNA